MKVAVVYNKRTIDPTDVINIYGSATKEHYNPKTVELVAQALEKGGHTVKVIEGTMGSIEEMRTFMTKTSSNEPPGIVFNMAYGIQGHDRYTHLPAMLEMLGVPYTGSGPEAHAIVQDKVMTKIVMQKHNLPTANFWVFTSPQDAFDDLAFPVIVKPKMESTSMGMRVVDNVKDLQDAVSEEIAKYKQDALVEEFISGREFAVGLLGNGHAIEVFPIVEFVLENPDSIQTKSNKMKAPVEKVCPANLDPNVEAEMKRLCIKAFSQLGLHDYARVDIRMDEDGRMYILELNSMASLGRTGSFVAGAKAAGYTYDTLINKMLDVAAVRNFGESAAKFITHTHDSSQPFHVAGRMYLRSHLPTTIQFLRQITEINTSVRNVDNINHLGKIISKRLHHLGFSEYTHRQLDVGDVRYFANHIQDTNDVLLLTHLDIPYSPTDFAPFRETKTKIYGTGITESKGGIVVMLSALHALRFVKKLRNIKCGILLTTDDSLGGRHSADIISKYASHSKYVMGMKWGDLNGGIAVSGHGRDDYHVEMYSTKKYKWPDASGIVPLACKKISSLDRISQEGSRVSVQSLSARTSYGGEPDHVSLTIVTNFTNKDTGDVLEKKIHRILRGSNGTSIDISTMAGREPVVVTEHTKKMYNIVADAAKAASITVKDVDRFISSDISYVPESVPSLEGMGPLGDGARSTEEYILTDSLIDRAQLLSIVIHKCAAKTK